MDTGEALYAVPGCLLLFECIPPWVQSFRVLTSARLASCASGVCALLTPKPPTRARAPPRRPHPPRPSLTELLSIPGGRSPATAPHSLFPSGGAVQVLRDPSSPHLVPEGLGQTAGARGAEARPGGGPGWLRPRGGEPPEARDWSRHRGAVRAKARTQDSPGPATRRRHRCRHRQGSANHWPRKSLPTLGPHRPAHSPQHPEIPALPGAGSPRGATSAPRGGCFPVSWGPFWEGLAGPKHRSCAPGAHRRRPTRSRRSGPFRPGSRFRPAVSALGAPTTRPLRGP